MSNEWTNWIHSSFNERKKKSIEKVENIEKRSMAQRTAHYLISFKTTTLEINSTITIENLQIIIIKNKRMTKYFSNSKSVCRCALYSLFRIQKTTKSHSWRPLRFLFFCFSSFQTNLAQWFFIQFDLSLAAIIIFVVEVHRLRRVITNWTGLRLRQYRCLRHAQTTRQTKK